MVETRLRHHSQPMLVSKDRKQDKHHREHQGRLRQNWVYLGVKEGYKFLSENGNKGGQSIEEKIISSRRFKLFLLNS